MESSFGSKMDRVECFTKISLDHSLEKAGALETYFHEKVAEQVDIMFSEAAGWF